MTPAETLRALEADGAVTVRTWGLRDALERGPRSRPPGEDLWCVTWDGWAFADHRRFVNGALVLGREACLVRDVHRERGLQCERVVRRQRHGGALWVLRVLVRVSVPLPEPGLSTEGWEQVFVEALVAGRSVTDADRLCRAMLGAGVGTDTGDVERALQWRAGHCRRPVATANLGPHLWVERPIDRVRRSS